MPRSFKALLFGFVCLTGSAASLAGCDSGERVQLVLEATGGEAPVDGAMETAREVIERRVSDLGSPGAGVVRKGPNRIVVTLAGRRDVEVVKALIRRSGRLEFRLVDLRADPEQVRAGRAPPGSEILPHTGPAPHDRIPVRRRPIVTGSMIVDAQASFGAAGDPAVNITFDAAGKRRLAQATRDNVGQPFAIVLDGVVLSAPIINEPILGGQAQIGGGFDSEGAEQLAIALRSGALPVDLAVVQERVVER